jgi:putative spermidine/putrescine transport system ATP-binding protein
LSAPPLLRLAGVTKTFGSTIAVDGVDLDVAVGEFLTLLGPSGSGKSTMLMLIAGFHTLTRGEIWLDERPQSRVPPHRRRMGVVFQNYALFPHLSVFENIAFALRNLRWSGPDIDARVRELLQLVHLEGLEERRPSELSGGQQQRVALARALAFRPALLLLDEPLSALDKRLREQMLAEFRRIHRMLGTTMIFVTHDQDEALAMSDRIAVMEQGRIVQLGTPEAIYERPASEFVAEFIGDANLFPGIAGADGVVTLDDGSVVRCPHEVPPGTAVKLLLRPEHISLGAGANSVRAQVEDRLYMGRLTRYRLRTACGGLLQVQMPNQPGQVPMRPGQQVCLGWRPQDGRVIPQRVG